MSRLGKVKACIAAQDLNAEEKEQLERSLEAVGFDAAEGRLIFSDADVERMIDTELKEQLLLHRQAMYRSARQIDKYVKLEEAATRALNDAGVEPDGESDMVWQLLDSILDMDMSGFATKYGFASIPQMSNVIMNDAIAPAHEAYALFREAFFGATRNRQLQKDVMKALFDESFSNDQAGRVARALHDVNEHMRRLLNDEGAAIKRRKGYIFPTEHNSGVLRRFGGANEKSAARANWVAYMKENATVYNPANDKPFRGAELDQALNMMYDNIESGRPDAPALRYEVDGKQMSAAVRSEKLAAAEDEMTRAIADGADTASIKAEIDRLTNAKPVGMDGNYITDMPIADMRGQQRLVQFNSFDAWADYHEKMGVKDYFAAWHANIDAMSTEAAMMRMFGPDARKGFKYLQQKARHHSPDSRRWVSKEYTTNAKWAVVSGEINKGGGSPFARGVAGLGNWATAAFLGGASIPAALGDPATGMAAAGGLGFQVKSHLGNYIRAATSRRSAALVQLGMGAAGLVNGLKTMNRFTEVERMEGWSARSADFFTRLSGLQWLTKAGDEAAPTTVLNHIANHIDSAYDTLPERFRTEFWEAFGMTADDWASVQKARDGLVYIDGDGLVTGSGKGAPLFNLRQIDAVLDERQATELRQKIMYAIETYKDYALLKGNTAARAFTTGGLPQASPAGVFVRMMTQFATHPMTMATGPLKYAITHAIHDKSYRYLAGLAGFTLMAGALIEQSKAMAAGRDPEDMTTGGFWLRAFAKGGGGGFYADLISAVMQGKQGIAQSIFGPRFRVLTDSTAWASNAIDAAKNGKGLDRYMAETMADMSGLSPTSTHFLLLNFHKAMVDGAVEWSDPAYARARNARAMRYYERERGQRFWWRPGEWTPSRAPDMSEVAGE